MYVLHGVSKLYLRTLHAALKDKNKANVNPISIAPFIMEYILLRFCAFSKISSTTYLTL